jgi:hypothetical protein
MTSLLLNGVQFERIVNCYTDDARYVDVIEPLNLCKDSHLSPSNNAVIAKALSLFSSSLCNKLEPVIYHHTVLFNVRLFDFQTAKGIGVVSCESIPRYKVIMELSGPVLTDIKEVKAIDENIRSTGIDSHFFFWKSHSVSKTNHW